MLPIVQLSFMLSFPNQAYTGFRTMYDAGAPVDSPVLDLPINT